MNLVWNAPPPLAEIAAAIESHEAPLYLIICLPNSTIPVFKAAEPAGTLEQKLSDILTTKITCLHFNGPNVLPHILPNIHLWLMPSEHTSRLADYFSTSLHWQTETIPQVSPQQLKPWYAPPTYRSQAEHVIVVGAGIAGAATAYELAQYGVRVSVLETNRPAMAGSGNRQGLLYAKISPHNTEQTELLLCGYGHTRRLLQQLLPEQNAWGGNGVLHLNYSAAEGKRNQQLSEHSHHHHLYRYVTNAEASAIAGIDIFSDGLYWPQGVWLSPRHLVHALLSHPLIELHTNTPALSTKYDGTHWHIRTPTQTFRASHVVYCMGAHSPNAPDINAASQPYRLIRGQTSLARATPESAKLRCALSGASYISPAWEGLHCFGATFIQHDIETDWRDSENQSNRQELAELNPALAADLFSDGLTQPQGHAALRCDSTDHLPIVGPLADTAALRQAYAKLAADKNYPINTPSPYLPGAYINTAHGSRGLATAPLCASAIAADILGLPNPLSPRLRTALHPNRAAIRALIKQQENP